MCVQEICTHIKHVMEFDKAQMIFLQNFFSNMGIEDGSAKFDSYVKNAKNQDQNENQSQKEPVDVKCTSFTKKGTRCTKNKSKLNTDGLCAIHFKSSTVIPLKSVEMVPHGQTKSESIESLFEDAEFEVENKKKKNNTKEDILHENIESSFEEKSDTENIESSFEDAEFEVENKKKKNNTKEDTLHENIESLFEEKSDDIDCHEDDLFGENSDDD